MKTRRRWDSRRVERLDMQRNDTTLSRFGPPEGANFPDPAERLAAPVEGLRQEINFGFQGLTAAVNAHAEAMRIVALGLNAVVPALGGSNHDWN